MNKKLFVVIAVIVLLFSICSRIRMVDIQEHYTYTVLYWLPFGTADNYATMGANDRPDSEKWYPKGGANIDLWYNLESSREYYTNTEDNELAESWATIVSCMGNYGYYNTEGMQFAVINATSDTAEVWFASEFLTMTPSGIAYQHELGKAFSLTKDQYLFHTIRTSSPVKLQISFSTEYPHHIYTCKKTK